MIAPVPEDDRYTPAEADAQLRAMSAADFVRARRYAEPLGSGLVDRCGDDLLHDAYLSLQSGERSWSRGMPAVVALFGAIKSMASNARKRQRKGAVDHTQGVSTISADVDEGETPPAMASDAEDPLRLLEGARLVDALAETVKDDDDLSLLLIAWGEGLRGEEAAAELGWDMRKYEAARKKLTRRISSLEHGQQ